MPIFSRPFSDRADPDQRPGVGLLHIEERGLALPPVLTFFLCDGVRHDCHGCVIDELELAVDQNVRHGIDEYVPIAKIRGCFLISAQPLIVGRSGWLVTRTTHGIVRHGPLLVRNAFQSVFWFVGTRLEEQSPVRCTQPDGPMSLQSLRSALEFTAADWPVVFDNEGGFRLDE